MTLKPYHGPRVTRIVVMKSDRKMYLLNGSKTLKSFDIDLGFAPVGDKKVEGDGKTPEGRYHIDRRNPYSKFYLSVGISYPNRADIAEAAALGEKPGGDIFIHGQPNAGKAKRRDWSAGCISVQNREMRDIYRMVEDGTVIDIYP